MSSAAISEVTDASFSKEVLEASGTVLVDFWAPWCGPCRSQAPVLEAVAHETSGRLKVAKVNVDASPAVANRYNIRGIPALIFFQRGQPVAELVGLQTRDQILQQLRSLSSTDDGVSASQSIILECPSCGQKNRAPAARSGDAICGRCKAPLFAPS